MKKFFINSLLLFVFSILLPNYAFAADSPTLVTPNNNATFSTTKPKLTWTRYSTCEAQSCYKVEISGKEDFSLLEKTSYTNGVVDPNNSQILSYSPTLSEGTWYWHLKGKNDDESWSNFSDTRTFTISFQAQPQPTTSPNQNVLGASSTQNKQNFTISANTNKVKDLDPLSVSVTLQNLDPNTIYYLKSAFYKEGSTNYFGLTGVQNNWVKNGSSFDTQYQITTDGSGNWQGDLEVKNDPTDTGYPGSGDYQFKIGRYSDSGSGPTWSNSLSINLEAKKMTATTTGTATTPTSTTPPTPAETPTPAFNTNDAVLGAQTSALESNPDSSDINYKLPDITAKGGGEGGIIPPIDQKVLVAGQKTTNWWFISSGMILTAIGAFYYWRSKRKHSLI